MRRHEKQISDRAQIDAVIRKCRVCRLALAVDDRPYLVPLCFGYDGQYLYFHTAHAGKKIEYLQTNPSVCFELEHDLRLITSAAQPCAWGFGFATVIGYGRMIELIDMEDKIRGLHHIIAQYGGEPGALDRSALDGTRVWQLTIDAVTGKRSPAGTASSL